MNFAFGFLLTFWYLNAGTFARPSGIDSQPLKFTELIKHFGYTGESHWVTTSDGYILRVDRITSGPSTPAAEGKPVVFLMHGITGASEHFVFWERSTSLAYLLVDSGYDVWLGNNRGNTNSRNHTTLPPDARPFWNFTLTDLGTKDLPTMIDFVLTKTGQQRLAYVGHSCGTTISYILLSELPQYNEKMSVVVSLAPVALWNPSSVFFLKMMANAAVKFFQVTLAADDYSVEIFSSSSLTSSVCNFWNQAICLWLLNTFLGHPSVPFSDDDFKYVAMYVPAGSSLKVFNHFRQNINSASFANYDYGNAAANRKQYGQDKPPLFDLKKITAPVAVFYSYNDPVSPKDSIDKLAATLPNFISTNVVNAPTFTHTDYFYHDGMRSLFGDKVVEIINGKSTKIN